MGNHRNPYLYPHFHTDFFKKKDNEILIKIYSLEGQLSCLKEKQKEIVKEIHELKGELSHLYEPPKKVHGRLFESVDPFGTIQFK